MRAIEYPQQTVAQPEEVDGIIKIAGAEIPIGALDHPGFWVLIFVIIIAVAAFFWLKKQLKLW